jgi:predicted ATP-dependent endonuclease of OLD family
MRLKAFSIENFRSYKERVTILFDKINIFVGQNDIGKSTILEALEIFLTEKNPMVKIDKEDVNKHALKEANLDTVLSAVFDELPSELIIDVAASTTLKQEYLLNHDGDLEIVKKFSNGSSEKVFVRAFHPNNPKCADLLLLKQAELKKLLTDEMVCNDKTKNAEIRKAIWAFYSDSLDFKDTDIELAKIESKNTWDQIKKYLPLFALFQSDRKNSDGDSEVQNPLKFAVQEILRDEKLSQALNLIATEVENKLQDVAERTLKKLKEMNPEIANQLSPVIPKAESLKWVDVFKSVSIATDDDILINKRGSGVKRLILLNFFRAEAERRRTESNVPDIIYAIEEPETSQHPKHQRMLISALKALATSVRTQVLMTTHSPGIIKMMEFSDIRLFKMGNPKEVVGIEKRELPYPSLNEINFLAFGESDEEYHDELYGHIELSGWLDEFKVRKPVRVYNRDKQGKQVVEQKVLSEYIRHQIHHPENIDNPRYSLEELQASINEMRSFLSTKK